MPRVINPSEFRQLFRFENFAREANASGGFSESYEQFFNTRGKLEKIDGSRYLDYGADILSSTYRATCYWRGVLENGLTKNTRLIYENGIYKILKYEKVGEQRKYYEFIVIEAH